jgi:uncharacterized protein with PQ loop repeat
MKKSTKYKIGCMCFLTASICWSILAHASFYRDNPIRGVFYVILIIASFVILFNYYKKYKQAKVDETSRNFVK